MRTLNYEADLCVVGGGLAGLCTAVAAARGGIKTVLVQDRPVLGGNASSEIRMWICGAHGTDNRETGILEEMVLKNFYRNPYLNYYLWDTVLYETAMLEPNIKLLLNSSCLDAEMDGNKIVSIKAWQSNAESYHVVKAKYFADCSGDSILSTLTGAEFRQGREAKSEYGETIPPDVADSKTMGMSCLMQSRETTSKTEFIPPKWAYRYDDPKTLENRTKSAQSNFWWLEYGGEKDCVHDTDECREELLKIALGVWDFMKRNPEFGGDNWNLDWIGFLPGKRESRRYIGKHVITENDVRAEGRFHDIVAYAGWSMDDHFPEGFYYKGGHPTIYHSAPSPWGIPLRALISKNIENLVFAGRNISVTHAALSSCRVMGSCALMGQAIGTAVAQAVKDGVAVEDVDIAKLQQKLMADDCYIPWHDREVPELTKSAKVNCEVVRNGKDRGEGNLWIGKSGEYLEYTFDADTRVENIRLVFDSDLNRTYHNMPANYPLNQKIGLPGTLVREYIIEAEDSLGNIERFKVEDNHCRLANHKVDFVAKRVRLIPVSTWGNEEYRVFDFELS